MDKSIITKKWLTDITVNVIQDENNIETLISYLIKLRTIANESFVEMNMKPIEEFSLQDMINFRFEINNKEDVSKMFKFATSLNAKLNHSNIENINSLISVFTKREDVIQKDFKTFVINDTLLDILTIVRDTSIVKDRKFNIITNDIFKINLEGNEKNIADAHSFPLGIKLKNSNEKFWGNDIFIKKDALN